MPVPFLLVSSAKATTYVPSIIPRQLKALLAKQP